MNTTDSRAELSFDVQRSPSLPEYVHERAVTRLASRLTDGMVTMTASRERSHLLERAARPREPRRRAAAEARADRGPHT